MVAALRNSCRAFMQPAPPVKAVCLAAIVVTGLVFSFNADQNAWTAAGSTFQGAALIAGVLACIWSSGVIIQDADSGMVETIVATGYPAGRYIARKLVGVLIPLLLTGIVLLVFTCLARLLLFGSFDCIPLACALTSIYLPICIFSICLSACVGTLTGTKAVAALLFCTLWMAGMLWLPPVARTFDVTGLALNQAYFETPLNENTKPQDLSDDTFAQVMTTQNEQISFARCNICFLALGSLFSLSILVLQMRRWWKFDVTPLLPGSRTGKALLVPLSKSLPGLKLLGWNRVIAVVVSLFAFDALALAIPDSASAIPWVTESFFPLVFAILYAGISTPEAKNDVDELTLCLPRIGKIHVQRILFVTIVLCALLCLQAFVFEGIVASGFAGVFFMGFAPAIGLGGLAYMCNMKMKFESTAMLVVIAVWSFLHIPLIAAIAGPTGFWLYPFPSSFGFEASWPLRISSVVLGIAFFYAGYRSIQNKQVQEG